MEEPSQVHLQQRRSHIHQLMESFSLIAFPEEDGFVFIDREFYPSSLKASCFKDLSARKI